MKFQNCADSHVPYLLDLINFFKNDTECKEAFGKNILIKSEYRGMDESSQKTPGLWIIPLETKAKDVKVLHDCRSLMKHRFLVCVVVKCPRNTVDHFDISEDDDGCYLLGPFMNASYLLKKVRDKVQCAYEEYEKQAKRDCCYSRPQLTDIVEPDELNGVLHICHIYETTFSY